MSPKILTATLLAITLLFITVTNANAQSWNLTGNAGINTATNFIGTTDSKNFIIRTKNLQRINVAPTGNILIGTGNSPIAKLEMRNTTEINSMYLNNGSTNSNQFGVRVSVNGVNGGAFRKGGEFITTGAGSNNTAVQGQASAALANYGGNFIATDGATSNIAVWGYAGGPTGSTNYAVYGSLASFSAGKDFAGYFDGPAYSKTLLVGSLDVAKSSAAIEVQTSLANGVNVLSSSLGGNGIRATYTGSPTTFYAVWGIAPMSGNNYAGYFSGNVHYTGTLSSFSDERLKENINPLNSVTDKIMQISVSTYSFKKGYSNLNLPQVKQYGFIAQNLEKIFPELVQNVADKSKGENNLVEYKAVNYLGMIPILTKALQEEHIQRLQTEQELKDIKQRLENIEALLSQNPVLSQATMQKTLNTATTAKLDQNAPNPFNQKSTINCFVPSNSKTAMVIVYSGNGNKIKTFNNLNAGINRLDINASTLEGGIYSYVLLIDGKQVDSKQMIVTR
jgi:hypothetical protein